MTGETFVKPGNGGSGNFGGVSRERESFDNVDGRQQLHVEQAQQEEMEGKYKDHLGNVKEEPVHSSFSEKLHPEVHHDGEEWQHEQLPPVVATPPVGSSPPPPEAMVHEEMLATLTPPSAPRADREGMIKIVAQDGRVTYADGNLPPVQGNLPPLSSENQKQNRNWNENAEATAPIPSDQPIQRNPETHSPPPLDGVMGNLQPKEETVNRHLETDFDFKDHRESQQHDSHDEDQNLRRFDIPLDQGDGNKPPLNTANTDSEHTYQTDKEKYQTDKKKGVDDYNEQVDKMEDDQRKDDKDAFGDESDDEGDDDYYWDDVEEPKYTDRGTGHVSEPPSFNSEQQTQERRQSAVPGESTEQEERQSEGGLKVNHLPNVEVDDGQLQGEGQPQETLPTDAPPFETPSSFETPPTEFPPPATPLVYPASPSDPPSLDLNFPRSDSPPTPPPEAPSSDAPPTDATPPSQYDVSDQQHLGVVDVDSLHHTPQPSRVDELRVPMNHVEQTYSSQQPSHEEKERETFQGQPDTIIDGTTYLPEDDEDFYSIPTTTFESHQFTPTVASTPIPDSGSNDPNTRNDDESHARVRSGFRLRRLDEIQAEQRQQFVNQNSDRDPTPQDSGTGSDSHTKEPQTFHSQDNTKDQHHQQAEKDQGSSHSHVQDLGRDHQGTTDQGTGDNSGGAGGSVGIDTDDRTMDQVEADFLKGLEDSRKHMNELERDLQQESPDLNTVVQDTSAQERPETQTEDRSSYEPEIVVEQERNYKEEETPSTPSSPPTPPPLLDDKYFGADSLFEEPPPPPKMSYDCRDDYLPMPGYGSGGWMAYHEQVRARVRDFVLDSLPEEWSKWVCHNVSSVLFIH